jgi:hypothetical protein
LGKGKYFIFINSNRKTITNQPKLRVPRRKVKCILNKVEEEEEMEVCLECEETFDNSVEEEEALDHGGGIVESSSKTI